jgi:hypothetical protein
MYAYIYLYIHTQSYLYNAVCTGAEFVAPPEAMFVEQFVEQMAAGLRERRAVQYRTVPESTREYPRVPWSTLCCRTVEYSGVPSSTLGCGTVRRLNRNQYHLSDPHVQVRTDPMASSE